VDSNQGAVKGHNDMLFGSPTPGRPIGRPMVGRPPWFKLLLTINNIFNIVPLIMHLTFGAAVLGAKTTPLLPIELLPDPVRRRDDVPLLVLLLLSSWRPGRSERKKLPMSLAGKGVRRGVSEREEDVPADAGGQGWLPAGYRRVGYGRPQICFRESMATSCHTPMLSSTL
jgi:hypothetical protein